MDTLPNRELQAPVNVHPFRRPAAKPEALPKISQRAELLAILRSHRVTDAIAHDLASAAATSGLHHLTLALASALDRKVKSSPLQIDAANALLLVGSYGAGKTAVACKLMALARVMKRPARIFALCGSETAADGRLEAVARDLDLPFARIETAEMLAAVVAGCIKKGTLAIVDSRGFDPRSPKARTAFSALGQITELEAVGVVSAAGDAEETGDLCAALGSIGASQLIVTGVDATARLGALVSAAVSGPSLAYISCSPLPSAGFECLTPLSLAQALVGSSGEPDEALPQ